YNYQGYYDTTCSVELDEEPPHDLNKDALNVVLVFSKLVNAKIVKRIEVMRKIIANGSVTSGFQRTSLIASDGILKNEIGNVNIDSILLEEDACKDIAKNNNSIDYRLDRQGIPLIEISTDASIKTPEHAKQIASQIGMLLRSTNKVKRGLGTIRQDLNISIHGGNRVELKGAQDLKNLQIIIDSEILRQINLNKIKHELSKMFNGHQELVEYDNINDFEDVEIFDLSDIFKNSDSKVINSALDNNGVVYGIKLNCFKGFLGCEIQDNRRLGSELSDYAKVESGVGGIFHSDELPKYGIENFQVNHIIDELNCKEKDAFIICADKKEKVILALFAAYRRARMAIKIGVIDEVRAVVKTFTSVYMRPIPGSSRMYPETDVKSIIPDISNIELPELIDDKINRYKSLGLGEDLARDISKDYSNNIFEELIKDNKNLKSSSIAEKFLSIPKELRRKDNLEFNWDLDMARFIFELWNENKIDHACIYDIILEFLNTNSTIEIISKKYKLLDDGEAIKKIKEIIDFEMKSDSNINRGKLMGILMGKLKGKVNPTIVSKEVSKIFN
ncbi:Glu-tRNA(Gln) amidotransferase subunit GatE, partial [Candidatus Woesearchaeota archaeon]|nr:Glu-tRNA(Gln) amidotransferase subunit GatE [Candidatus Woesearchaeota archaeon]